MIYQVPIPDPDDTVFLEVAVQTDEKMLVTGNVRHFPKRCCGEVNVMTR